MSARETECPCGMFVPHETEAECVRELRDSLSAAERRAERLADLVAHCRQTLHEENLISDEEYAALAGTGAARRLESYDEVRERLALAERRAEEAEKLWVRWEAEDDAPMTQGQVNALHDTLTAAQIRAEKAEAKLMATQAEPYRVCWELTRDLDIPGGGCPDHQIAEHVRQLRKERDEGATEAARLLSQLRVAEGRLNDILGRNEPVEPVGSDEDGCCLSCGRGLTPCDACATHVEREARSAREQASAMAAKLLPQIDATRLARLVQLFLAPVWTSDEEHACRELTGRPVLSREDLRREAGRVVAAVEGQP